MAGKKLNLGDIIVTSRDSKAEFFYRTEVNFRSEKKKVMQ
jgi:hypothetical protein